MKKIILVVCMCLLVVGCNNSSSQSHNISTLEVFNNISTNKYVIIDVREIDEYKEGHIQNAINISVDDIKEEVEKVIVNKDTNIVVYCRSGSRSSEALKKLIDLGYTNVYDMGGIISWEYDLVK